MKAGMWRQLAMAIPLVMLAMLPARFAHAVSPAPTFAAQWPRSGQALFDVKLDSGLLIGQNRQSWRHDGKHWQIRSETVPSGVAVLFSGAHAVQESRGIFVPAGLQPLEYKTEKNGKPKDNATFDLAARRIGFKAGDPAPLTVQTQDQLSLFYQLGALDSRAAPATLMMTTGRKVHSYRVEFAEPQSERTLLGERMLRLARIARVGNRSSSELTEVWIDEASRLPFRIRYRDRKGKVFDQILVALELENSK